MPLVALPTENGGTHTLARSLARSPARKFYRARTNKQTTRATPHHMPVDLRVPAGWLSTHESSPRSQRESNVKGAEGQDPSLRYAPLDGVLLGLRLGVERAGLAVGLRGVAAQELHKKEETTSVSKGRRLRGWKGGRTRAKNAPSRPSSRSPSTRGRCDRGGHHRA